MPRYFRYFPNVKHSGKFVVDITKRSKFIQNLFADPTVFLPFVIQEGERAEDVAFLYYEDVNKVWLLYLANNIIDPYKQWPMTQSNFQKYLIEKYKVQSEALTNQNVLNWTQNTVKHYYLIEDEETIISRETYDKSVGVNSLDPSFVSGEWQSVTYYEYEEIVNENNRHISVIDRRYADQVERELKRVMNE